MMTSLTRVVNCKKVFVVSVAAVVVMVVVTVMHLTQPQQLLSRSYNRGGVKEALFSLFVESDPSMDLLLVAEENENQNVSVTAARGREGWTSRFPRLHSPATNLYHMPKELEKEPPAVHDPAIKKILIWNDFVRNKHYWFGLGRKPFILANCPVDTCLLTANRTLYAPHQLDAVLWHFMSTDKSLPPNRSSHTRYIFAYKESPLRDFGNLKDFDNLFNWTLTYRLDSDIPWPYSFMMPRRPETPKNRSSDILNLVAHKTKMAAWFVSNCHSLSGRHILTKGLEKHMQVDVYGKCGSLSCPRKQEEECQRILERDYYFYFAFENSMCRDYVTEKFFNALRYYVVPVVWGLATYPRHAPKHSYINALDFPTIKDLAAYLTYLSRNHTAYMEYFRWKDDEEVVGKWSGNSEAFCALCEKLHTDDEPKVYKSMFSWYNDNTCRLTTDPYIKNFLLSS